MNKSRLHLTIQACLENGERLLSDAEMLEFSEPPATAFALTIIAQEEFAKAFLINLIYKGIIQWDEYIWRASRDHTCKQLLTMVMDYLNPDDSEFMKRISVSSEGSVSRTLPRHIADALNIFRHEKIRRWESQNWVWADPPNYDPKAKKVGKGHLDRLKQDQLYIDIAKDGSVIPKGVITPNQLKIEKDRAERLCSLVRGMVEGERMEYSEYHKVTEAFRVLFASKNSESNEKP